MFSLSVRFLWLGVVILQCFYKMADAYPNAIAFGYTGDTTTDHCLATQNAGVCGSLPASCLPSSDGDASAPYAWNTLSMTCDSTNSQWTLSIYSASFLHGCNAVDGIVEYLTATGTSGGSFVSATSTTGKNYLLRGYCNYGAPTAMPTAQPVAFQAFPYGDDNCEQADQFTVVQEEGVCYDAGYEYGRRTFDDGSSFPGWGTMRIDCDSNSDESGWQFRAAAPSSVTDCNNYFPYSGSGTDCVRVSNGFITMPMRVFCSGVVAPTSAPTMPPTRTPSRIPTMVPTFIPTSSPSEADSETSLGESGAAKTSSSSSSQTGAITGGVVGGVVGGCLLVAIALYFLVFAKASMTKIGDASATQKVSPDSGAASAPPAPSTNTTTVEVRKADATDSSGLV